MKKLIIIFLFFSNILSAEIFWDGRFYQQALFLIKQNGKYIGLTALDVKLDTRPDYAVRIRSELEYFLLNNNEYNLLGKSADSTGVTVNSVNAAINICDFKVTIGRFLPDWGKGKIFKPLDIFKPQTYFFNMLSFQGIDGFLIKYYLSDLSSVQFIAVPSIDVRNLTPQIKPSFTNSLNHTLAGFNFAAHIYTFDNNFIFVKDTSADNNIIGFAFKGDVIVGLWSEIFYSFNNKLTAHTLRYTIGADYSFFKYFFISMEYFYDESGVSDYKNYIFFMKLISRMTYGRKYFMIDFNVLTYEELNYGITYLGNLGDKSFILFPYFRYEIFENSILGVSIYHFNGKADREFNPDRTGDFIINTYLNIRF